MECKCECGGPLRETSPGADTWMCIWCGKVEIRKDLKKNMPLCPQCGQRHETYYNGLCWCWGIISRAMQHH
jgi:rubrerythrin